MLIYKDVSELLAVNKKAPTFYCKFLIFSEITVSESCNILN
jgi:hypothetical protein